MSRITRHSAITILLASALACSSSSSSSGGSQPKTVIDTLNHVFDVNCSSGICALTPEDPAVKPRACDSVVSGDTFVVLWSRILTIHVLILSPSGPMEWNAGEPGKPLACTSDDDCTPWNVTIGTTNYQYTCSNAVCQDPAVSLIPEDVITLCQADIPWPSSCPYIATEPFASRLVEVAATCKSVDNCSVPADCHQVTPTPDGGAQPASMDSSANSSVDSSVNSSVDSSVDSGP